MPEVSPLSVSAGHESELAPLTEACDFAQWAAPESASDGLRQLPSKDSIIKGRGMSPVMKGWLD